MEREVLFPADSFSTIMKLKSEFRKMHETIDNSDVQSLKAEIEELSQQRDALAKPVDDSRERKLQQQQELLIDQKRALDNDVLDLEGQISQLKHQILKISKDPSSRGFEEALAIMRSIAPIRITDITDIQISGVIAGGTLETTKSFTLLRNQPDSFWKLLESVFPQ